MKVRTLFLFICTILASSLSAQTASNLEMIQMLEAISDSTYTPENPAATRARVEHFRKRLSLDIDFNDSLNTQYLVCQSYLELGKEEAAIRMGKQMLQRAQRASPGALRGIRQILALAYLRHGERINCIGDHAVESCIFPIRGSGIQRNTTSTLKAIELYEQLVSSDPTDLDSKWLLNVAYMAIGRYPDSVPAHFLIRGLDSTASAEMKPFTDVAMTAGVATSNMAGGSIVEDFNNDGYADMITSAWGLEEGMHYHQNNGDGTFSDLSESSGLRDLTGGLNILQTDYDNDGLKDVFVLRGAWLRQYGRQPNSLLRNNGDGTFTDVTIEAGLLSFHPTQTATWADFNNDGWLDVFIGNETTSPLTPHPCELYLNNGDGTFTEVAAEAGCNITLFVKGVSSGDYDRDGKVDIFISTMNGRNVLLKNRLGKNGKLRFRDVTDNSGLAAGNTPTFTTWSWDFDNDGWLDIFCAAYNPDKPIARYAAMEAMNMPTDKAGKMFVYRNLGNGKFEEVSDRLGLSRIAYAMGGNFGDIDNDGFLDIYLGTGNPFYESVIPNRMFLNRQGSGFEDVTLVSRTGNLQKGHGVSFADIDNDGDQDIHIEMGGAFPGDAYQNALYENPGQNDHHWIKLTLEGMSANKAAIGAKIRVDVIDDGTTRSVYREVNSGGSFGANSLTQHIGLGQAGKVEKIEIIWPGTNTRQEILSVVSNQHLRIREGQTEVTPVHTKPFKFRPGSAADHRHTMH